MKTSIVCVAVFMLFMALHPAHAQRCPAGADAFLNCLPLDHRYGGPGEISRPQMQRAMKAHRNTGNLYLVPHRNTGNRYLDCIYNRQANLIRRGDPRALRQVEETRRRGTAIGTPDFQSTLRENERACK